MSDPPQTDTDTQDLIDHLIAISVVARHLARRLEQHSKNNEEKNHEPNERTGGDPG